MTHQEELIKIARPWLRLLFIALVLASAIFALRELLPLLRWIFGVIQPFLIALIVAYVFHPIVTFVQKKLHLGRVAGIALLALSIAAVLIGALIWLIPVLYQQIIITYTDLSNSLPKIFANFMDKHFSPETAALVLAKINESFGKFRSSIDSLISEMGTIKPVAQGGLTAVKSVAGALTGAAAVIATFLITTAFVVVISIYYLADMDAFPHIIRKLLPVRHREAIWSILLQADQSVGGFLRGQLIACVIVGVLTSILLFFVGMRQYAILIGSFAGLMHLVPYLGPIAGGTPAVLFVLLSQQFATWKERGFYILLVLVGFSMIETFDGLVTQPFIVGKRASLHPLAVILALAVGAQFGLSGMIIAVPTMCFVRVLWVELYWKKRSEHSIPDLEKI